MPVQTDINSLSTTPASNSPAGGEAANLVDDYLRQASAHIATLNGRTSNINNTSDANKPISTATQTALNLKLSLDGSTPMTGQFRSIDGTAAAPGMSFANSLGTGFYRSGSSIGWGIGTVFGGSFGVGSLQLSPANPGADYGQITVAGGLLSLVGDAFRIDGGNVVRMGLSGAANTDLITSRTNGIAFNRFVVGRFDMRGSSPSNIGTTTTSGTLFAFYSDNGSAAVSAGGISVSGSTTTYATASDARLKVNIADSADAGAILDAIRVRQFDWRGNDKHERYGFIAQELMAHAPEAVAMPHDDDGYFGVDASKLVPLLVKEIQSLRRRVETLEAVNG